MLSGIGASEAVCRAYVVNYSGFVTLLLVVSHYSFPSSIFHVSSVYCVVLRATYVEGIQNTQLNHAKCLLEG